MPFGFAAGRLVGRQEVTASPPGLDVILEAASGLSRGWGGSGFLGDALALDRINGAARNRHRLMDFVAKQQDLGQRSGARGGSHLLPVGLGHHGQVAAHAVHLVLVEPDAAPEGFVAVGANAVTGNVFVGLDVDLAVIEQQLRRGVPLVLLPLRDELLARNGLRLLVLLPAPQHPHPHRHCRASHPVLIHGRFE